LDLDLQHRFRWRQRHEVVWGLGYRLSNDKTRSGDGVALHPHDRLLNLGSFFVQDDFTLLPDTLRLIAGTKIEHNDFTGFEIQPSGRVLWLPTRSQTVWAAISRAVRMPTRADSDVRFDVNVIPPATSSDLPVRVTVLGNEDFESENLLSYEIGYRLEPFAAALVDLATFYNEYHDLRTQRSGDPAFQAQPSPHIEQPLIFENGMHGHAYGFELAASYRPASWCKVSAGYTWFDLRLRLDPSSQDVGSLVHARNDPQNQVNARLYLDLPWNFELDTMLYYVDRFLAGFGAGAVPVSSYIRPDMRLSWRPHEQLALSVTVQDLAANSRVEQVPGLGGSPPVEIPRIAFGQVRWVF
jgi:iron complex outermembrane receptor protein